MKTSQNFLITLMSFLLPTLLLAQTESPKSPESEPMQAIQNSYYQKPPAPKDYPATAGNRSGYSNKFLNINKVPASLLLRLANHHPVPENRDSESTFDIGLYRVQKSMTMRLTMEKKAGVRVVVRLLDQQGQILHQEEVSRLTMKYACSFNFSTIRDGRYTIEVANGAEVKRRPITLTTVAVLETPARTLMAQN